MDKLGFRLDEDSSNSDQNQINPQDSRKLNIQRNVQSLVHSSYCTDVNCCRPGCENVKKFVAHARHCERKRGEGCSVCKRYIAVCYHHAKACQEVECPVLFCLNIKYKLREQEAEFLKSQIETMPSPEAQTNAEQSYAASPPSPAVQTNVENSYATSLPSPALEPPAPSYPTQSGLDMRGPSQIVSERRPSLPNEQHNYLQTLIQTLKFPNSSEQQQQELSILKSNPQLVAAFIKQRTAHKSVRQQQQQQLTQPPASVTAQNNAENSYEASQPLPVAQGTPRPQISSPNYPAQCQSLNLGLTFGIAGLTSSDLVKLLLIGICFLVCLFLCLSMAYLIWT